MWKRTMWKRTMWERTLWERTMWERTLWERLSQAVCQPRWRGNPGALKTVAAGTIARRRQ